jgi:hypothetical protein
MYGIEEIELRPEIDSDGNVLPSIEIDAEMLPFIQRMLNSSIAETLLHETFEHVVANMSHTEFTEWYNVMQQAQSDPNNIPYITFYSRMIAVNGDIALAYKEDLCETASMFYGSVASMYKLSVVSPSRFEYMVEFTASRLPEEFRDSYRSSIMNDIAREKDFQEKLDEQFPEAPTTKPAPKGAERIKKVASEHLEIPEEKLVRGTSQTIKTAVAGQYRSTGSEGKLQTGKIILYVPVYTIRKAKDIE